MPFAILLEMRVTDFFSCVLGIETTFLYFLFFLTTLAIVIIKKSSSKINWKEKVFSSFTSLIS